MIHREKPRDFNPRFEIASCYLMYDGKILLLHRQSQKSQGGKWGVPAGKMEAGENPLEAMERELEEETGISAKPADFKFLDTVFVRYPDHDFIYHMFSLALHERPDIKISNAEHQDFTWVSPIEGLKMELVDDLDACIKGTYSL